MCPDSWISFQEIDININNLPDADASLLPASLALLSPNPRHLHLCNICSIVQNVFWSSLFFSYRVFIKYCVFSFKCCDFSELCHFFCSAGVLPAIMSSVYTTLENRVIKQTKCYKCSYCNLSQINYKILVQIRIQRASELWCSGVLPAIMSSVYITLENREQPES